MKKVLIIGANSAIATACARIWALRGDAVCLVGRRLDALETLADDLRVRGASKVSILEMDACDYHMHGLMLNSVLTELGGLDSVLIAHGVLPDQQRAEHSAQYALDTIHTNALSVISLLTYLAEHFEAQGRGSLAVIGSVAGDRGRQSNYVYGAAKGMVAIFLQGLRNRLFKKGVHVLTIKPGFVDTPMTALFQKGALWASPDQVAQGIVISIDKRRDVAYLPGFWRWIMFVISHIPEFIFKRLSL